ncbi:GVQW3 protein, partial [Acromyrmex heyeri]
MKFLVKLKKTPTECYKLLKEAYGENSLSRARVFEWYKRFSEGRESTEDDQRPGRPVSVSTPQTVTKISSDGILQNTSKRIQKQNFISFGPLTIRVCTLNDATFRFGMHNVDRIDSTPLTLTSVSMFEQLLIAKLINTVKYTGLSNIASENTIRDCDIFDGYQFVDCKLLALVFNKTSVKNMNKNFHSHHYIYVLSLLAICLLSFDSTR